MRSTSVESPAPRMLGMMQGLMLGDALGYQVEFDSSPAVIRAKFPGGVRAFSGEHLYFGIPCISDDTQMSLFTAEAVLKVLGDETYDVLEAFAESYLRWYDTQVPGAVPAQVLDSGTGLHEEAVLQHRRAPGNTCLSQLGELVAELVREDADGALGGRNFDGFGAGPSADDWREGTTASRYVAGSGGGCGAVMRVAPIVALATPEGGDERELAEITRLASILTHDNPVGWWPAVVLVQMLATILRRSRGDGHRTAIREAWLEHANFESPLASVMTRHMRSAEVERLRSVAGAVSAECAKPLTDLSATDPIEAIPPNVFGRGGWAGDEALAIATWACLASDDPMECLAIAASHSGDTDSTAAICGALLGAASGPEIFPQDLLQQIDAHTIVADWASTLGEEMEWRWGVE